MRTRTGTALTLLAVVLGPACRRAGTPSRPAQEARAAGSAARLLAPGFRPPVDGLLTDEQVNRFIRVRRASKGRTDTDSAQALGIPPEELAWTRARIIEALVALDDRRVRAASAEVYARSLASLRTARAQVRDPSDARVIDEQIAALERERTALRRVETPPPALAVNMQCVARHRTEIEAVSP